MADEFSIPISNIVDVRLAAGTDAVCEPNKMLDNRHRLLSAFEDMDQANMRLHQFDASVLPPKFRAAQPTARLVVGLMERGMFTGIELLDQSGGASPVILLSDATYPRAAGEAVRNFVKNINLKRRPSPHMAEKWCPQRRYN